MTASLHPMGTGPDAQLRNAIAGPLRHAGDTDLLLLGGARRWTDALLSETRAHLAGCLNAVELGLSLAMGDNWLSRPIEALGPNYCRSAIERHPVALSPLLVDHLRQRAACALAMRMALVPPVFPDQPAAKPPADVSSAVEAAAASLRLSVDPWFQPHPIMRPMRADLPAEPYCDLVWTATALLIEGLAARMGVEGASAAPALIRTAQAMIGHHDEQNGPLARAAYLAVLIGDSDALAPSAQDAALRHDLLLIAALAGVRSGMAVERSLALLIDGEAEDRAALARLLDLDDAAYVALLDALAPLRDQDEDALLPDRLAQYRQLTTAAAARRLARWSGPSALIDKLAKMGWNGS